VDTDAGQAAADTLIAGNALIAVAVALLHTAAMMLSGGLIAVGVYYWMGLKFLSKGWFNLDLVWAVSLILVGVVSLLSIGHH
jgi:hypothetical protein